MVQMKIYVVRAGDSLFSIARRFGVSVESLIFDNQIADASRVAVGQALVIEDGTPGGALGRAEMGAYAYTHIDPEVLQETLPYLTYLMPFTWEVDVTGTLTPPGGASLNAAAYRQAVAPLMSIANLKPGGGFSSEIAHAILTDQAAQDTLVENIIAAVNMYDYFGVVLDIEYVYSFDRESFNQFTRRLASVLHPLGAMLGVALAPKVSADQAGLLYEGHDYAAQGEAADFILLMTYEWGYTYGPPMAVSPIQSVRRVLDYAVTEIPPQKILMGFSNYGYNWTLPWKKGRAAKVISNAAAANLAAQRNAEIIYDQVSQAPWFNYRDDAGVRHVVWFEDARAARARFTLIAEYGLRGVFWWTANKLFRQGLMTFESLYITEKVFGGV